MPPHFVSTPALCQVLLSNPWDWQQHRAHCGVGGQQHDRELWGKAEGSTILLGLLGVILLTVLFTRYFCFASRFFHCHVCLSCLGAGEIQG